MPFRSLYLITYFLLVCISFLLAHCSSPCSLKLANETLGQVARCLTFPKESSTTNKHTLYFIGNSIMRGEYFSAACHFQTVNHPEKNRTMCSFSGASKRLRERQINLCPKNKLRSNSWKGYMKTRHKQDKHKGRGKKATSLAGSFSCHYTSKNEVTLVYNWVDSLLEYQKALELAPRINASAIFVQVALQAVEELVTRGDSSRFFNTLDRFLAKFPSNRIFVKAINPYNAFHISAANKNQYDNKIVAKMNSRLEAWANTAGVPYLDEWSMLFGRMTELYADSVHPSVEATTAKLFCGLHAYCKNIGEQGTQL